MEGNLSEEEIFLENSGKKVTVDGVSQDLVTDSQKVKVKEVKSSFPFPFQRVRKLMNSVCEDSVRSDGVQTMMDATELFIQELSEKIYSFSKSKNRKTMVFSDVVDAINLHENLAFLRDSGIFNEIVASPTKKSKKSSNSAEINK